MVELLVPWWEFVAVGDRVVSVAGIHGTVVGIDWQALPHQPTQPDLTVRLDVPASQATVLIAPADHFVPVELLPSLEQVPVEDPEALERWLDS